MRQFSRIFVIALTGGILFSAVSCKKAVKQEAPVATEDSVATDSVQADTTVTGVALESGMSTIYLCTLGGDTIECDMEDELGSGRVSVNDDAAFMGIGLFFCFLDDVVKVAFLLSEHDTREHRIAKEICSSHQ